MDLLGSAVVKVDGQVLRSVDGSARLDPGGFTGTTRMGGGLVHGRSLVPKPSRVTVDLVIGADFDHAALQAIDAATIEFSDAYSAGLGWVIAEAWFTEMGEIEEGAESKVSVTFEGREAQKIGG